MAIAIKVPTYSRRQKLCAFARGLRAFSPFFEVSAEGLRVFDGTDQNEQRDEYLGKVKRGEFADICRVLVSGVSNETQEILTKELETRYHEGLVAVVGYLRNLALRMNYNLPLGGPSTNEVIRQIPSNIAVALNGGDTRLLYDRGSSILLESINEMRDAIKEALETRRITSQNANAALLRICSQLTALDVRGILAEVNGVESVHEV